MVHIGNSWDDVLKGEFDKDYYLKLREFLKQEYGSRTIYPNMYDIFNALKFTPYEDVKAVIRTMNRDRLTGSAFRCRRVCRNHLHW